MSLLALSGHRKALGGCPLLGVKRMQRASSRKQLAAIPRQSDISLAVAVLVDTIQSANSVTCDARRLMFMNWLIIIRRCHCPSSQKSIQLLNAGARAVPRAGCSRNSVLPDK